MFGLHFPLTFLCPAPILKQWRPGMAKHTHEGAQTGSWLL